MDKYNIFCLLSSIGLPVPIVISERNSPAEPRRKFIWALGRFFYPMAAGIITQSEECRRIYLSRAACKDVTVFPNPVNQFAVAPEVVRENIILNVGRLVELKGQRDLIAAFKALQEPDWRLVLCGGGPLHQPLMEYAQALGIGDRVEVTGTVTDVAARLQRARIFAFSSYSEGFPNALAEAMIAGLPCVSYDCPTGPAELIRDGENGHLVATGDIASLTDRLRRLIHRPAEAEALGRAASKIAERLNPQTVAAQYLNYCLSRAKAVKVGTSARS